jgi:hypothetical protein
MYYSRSYRLLVVFIQPDCYNGTFWNPTDNQLRREDRIQDRVNEVTGLVRIRYIQTADNKDLGNMLPCSQNTPTIRNEAVMILKSSASSIP